MPTWKWVDVSQWRLLQDLMMVRFVNASGRTLGPTGLLYPNWRAAASFNRLKLDIGTGSKGMKSDGVGKMLLYTANGASMPGFDRVVFASQAAAKLASIGDIYWYAYLTNMNSRVQGRRYSDCWQGLYSGRT